MTMQRCTATIRLAGDMKNTVVRHGLSPAEVLVLRHIHGNDAVVDFKIDGDDRGKKIDERGRLEARYGRKFREAFPGANPQFPDKLSDIGVDLNADDEDEAPKPRRIRAPRGVLADMGEAGAQPVSAADFGADADAEG
jgi:hypothetical protein